MEGTLRLSIFIMTIKLTFQLSVQLLNIRQDVNRQDLNYYLGYYQSSLPPRTPL